MPLADNLLAAPMVHQQMPAVAKKNRFDGHMHNTIIHCGTILPDTTASGALHAVPRHLCYSLCAGSMSCKRTT